MATLAHQLSTNCQVSSRAPGSPARLGHGVISRSDIGLSRADVYRLLAKPFWRA